MSVQCPECATEIQDDFGIISCPKCSAVFSVDADGHIVKPEINKNIYSENSSTESPIEALVDSTDDLIVEPADDSSAGLSSDQSMNAQPSEEFVELLGAGVLENKEEDLTSNRVSEVEPIGSIESFVEEPQNVFQEIKSFANSENIAGPLSYLMKVSGIDIKEVSDEVFSALSDPRFGWDQDYLKKQLKSGTLILGNLNPAQATMVLKNLRGINVQIQWHQEAINR